MVDIEKFFDAIDGARVQRVKELSEIKRIFGSISSASPFAIGSKAVVVLAYANWEGFYNECVQIYLEFLKECGTKVADAGWLMLTGTLSGDFDALRNRNHSSEGRKEFVARLQTRLNSGFDAFDSNVVMARSNLNYARLSENLTMLNFEFSEIQRSRIRLDKELVGWRHGVAHGTPPDLTAVNVSDHIDFASKLMLTVSDLFQNAILAQI